MNRSWSLPADSTLPPELLHVAEGNRLVAAALARRGISTGDAAYAFLTPDAYTPASPFDLPEMAAAVARVRRALHERESIAIWGDFDVDGQTATALLIEAFVAWGVTPQRHIPDRAAEGHGVHIAALARLIDAGARLIITCDTGITAHEAIAYANARGVDVIVTDHHHLGETLPDALANLNPQRLPHAHPMFTLPGVGVALQLVRAVSGDAAAAPFLDLVALGIVADVALQTGDTRYWLQRGLAALRARPRPGVAALGAQAKLNFAHADEADIGFTLAPRLNAAGRLAEAMLGVDMLLERDPARAHTMALQLENLNAQRRALVSRIEADALAMVAADPTLALNNVLLLAAPGWHPGIIGIVANRLAERYRRPALLLTIDGDEARGSARSVDGIHITEALAAHAGLLTSFGGHIMAAGLRLPVKNIAALRRGLSDWVASRASEPMAIVIDALATPVMLAKLDPTLIARLAPFGPGNPPVTILIPNVELASAAVIGKAAKHRVLTVVDEAGAQVQVVWWGGAEHPMPTGRIDLACTLRTRHSRDGLQFEFVYLDSRPAQAFAESVASPPRTVDDRRAAMHPKRALADLKQQWPDALVWREGGDGEAGFARHELRRAEHLIIWTCPPSRTVLRQVLATVSPTQIAIFASLPPTPEGGVQRRLLALLKFALANKGGIITLDALASALALTPEATKAGLDWAVAIGAIAPSTVSASHGELHVVAGHGAGNGTGEAAAFEAHLAEISAFRSFFRRATVQTLFP